MDVIRKKMNEASAALDAGFTLIEMIIVIAIFAVVATILLFQYSNFNTTVALRNLAEEMGLTIRKSQTYATSVRSVDGGGGILSNTFPAYGVSFSTNTTANTTYDPTNTSFTLFVDASPTSDTNTNNQFDNDGTCNSPAVGQECIESFAMDGGDKIQSIMVENGAIQISVPTVDIVFHRPNPDAVICVPTGGVCTIYSGAVVTVVSPKNITRTITVWNTGQIDVN